MFTLFFLFGAFFLTAMTSAFRRIQSHETRKKLKALGKFFFYRSFHTYMFPENNYEGIVFATICAQSLARFGYVVSAVFLIFSTPLFTDNTNNMGISQELTTFWIVLSFVTTFLVSFLVGEYIPRILGSRLPEKALRFCSPFASLFIFLAFPITYVVLKISHSFSRTVYLEHLNEPGAQTRQEIMDIIQETEFSAGFNPHDKKLIESVFSFRDRIAREVMVPRVNVFSLPGEMSIKKAAELLAAEGYSRTPVYHTTIDEITGVMMYKDILAKFREYENSGNDLKILEAPIETIQKGVLYTPETRKISSLLQEFRKKQVHLAIVVDEYGGTEGIVTIEDILEEIVGEIADEYDQEELPYAAQPDGSWIIDARMNILDAEEILGIVIPQEGEYDTVGGYVFHCAGAIPSPGFIIQQDAFDLEVINSNERVVEKIRIKPVRPLSPVSKKNSKQEKNG